MDNDTPLFGQILRTWLEADVPRSSAPSDIEVLKHRYGKQLGTSKTHVFRLVRAIDGERNVIAKLCQSQRTAWEAQIQTLCEEIGVFVPAILARLPGPEGYGWAFQEDVGEQRPDPDDTQELRLTASTLAALHTAAEGTVRRHAGPVPDRGMTYVMECISRIRSTIAAYEGCDFNRELTPSLHGINNLLSFFLMTRTDLVKALASTPHVFGHYDFTPKNLRIVPGTRSDVPRLAVLDWEFFGRGPNCVDLFTSGVATHPEGMDEYMTATGYRPSGQEAAIQKVVGRLIWRILSIDWLIGQLRYGRRAGDYAAKIAWYEQELAEVALSWSRATTAHRAALSERTPG